MNQETAKNLYAKYPKCFAGGEIPISCGNGWAMLIEHLLDHIQGSINKLPVETQAEVFVVQIKQKFGSLRVYMSKEIPNISKVISFAESISATTCEECGGISSTDINNSRYNNLCLKCEKIDAGRKFV